MKLKILNILSGISFFISSACLLSIPFLDLKEGFTIVTYILAGLFWCGLISGFVLQIILAKLCRRLPVIKNNKRILRIIGIAFLILLVVMIPVIIFFNDNRFVLPINLFLVLLSVEAYFVIRRMGRLNEYERIHKNG
ncbi:hypothetical protein CLHUN_40990 [Ruminiclostridium hungatei]|uniref:Lipoprotein n=1 Tax=Ruminiclostridium hungatei TaxID=48256 RepID=A0A1V4SDW0_RUMHU|nr:hypothetical protein [Ruminiclostridium hungatei]OPX42040.1 hypothetical protein CLHUN_40990 [Ruminiclostridium hungatei]